ncbi:multidrug efflux SMR transporter [Brevibacterium sp. UCMA 11754]|nr:multidrug efflux SMR transporter [Brevibacterium sp. UCMA 11754]
MADNCHVRRWLFLMGAIIAEVTGTLALKGALDSPALYILVGLGYAAAFVFLSLTLRVGMPLGIAYGIWGAAGVALTAILSHVLFAEPLTPVMITGIVFIMAGVILVEVGNREDDAHQSVPNTPQSETEESNEPRESSELGDES